MLLYNILLLNNWYRIIGIENEKCQGVCVPKKPHSETERGFKKCCEQALKLLPHAAGVDKPVRYALQAVARGVDVPGFDALHLRIDHIEV